MVMKKFIKSGLLLCAVVLTAAGQVAAGATIYVDSAAAGNNDGMTWTDAYVHLQDALSASSSGDEIQVAAGSYCPDMGDGYVAGDREVSFILKNGIQILGGFPAGGGDRDVEVNVTILSGDLSGNDGPATETADLLGDPCRADNSYHVIVGQYCGPLTVLDGFTIAAGHADGADDLGRGGGWFNTTNSSPTVTDCIFEKNAAALNGGGLYNRDVACKPPITDCEFRDNLSGTHGGGISCESNSFAWVISNCGFSGNVASTYGGGMYFIYGSPTVEDCEFAQNKAGYGGGLWADAGCNINLRRCVLTENIATSNGGALYNSNNTSTIESCEFSFNRANVYGGAICNSSSSPEISDTIFWDNVSVSSGGGIYNSWSHPIFTNCKFLANKTETGHGGAIHNYATSNPEFYNCIFSFNQSAVGSGGAMFNEYIHYRRYCSPKLHNCSLSWNTALGNGGGIYSNSSGNNIVLTNCILWNNVDTNGSEQDLSAQIWGSTYHVSYSCVQGWDFSQGEGNIDTDPMFVDPDGPDWMYGTLDDDLRLVAGSPCIDAGDSTAVPADIIIDLDGSPRFYDDPATADTGVPGDPCVCVDMGAYEYGAGGVAFCDANLKAAVEEALGVTNPTAEDMLDLVTLSADWREIGDLCGLEYATNLEYLYIQGNQITDLDEVEGLNKLEALYAHYNGIGAIGDLSNLTSLRYLSLYQNQIDDICPLAESGLTTLTNIRLKDNNVLTLESYQSCIPQIIANNPNLVLFEYDPNCQDNLLSDANGDCLVNLEDFAIMAGEWLGCDYIYQEMCP